MFRLIYRNPLEENAEPNVVSISDDLEDLKYLSLCILRSLLYDRAIYNDGNILYIEDLATGKRI